jgi:hypothetical protein
MKEEEKPLWYYASPQLEDIKVQKSNLILEATEYKIKPRMIEMVAANPFRGVKTDNPYRHVEHFTMLCNTVQQEGVLVNWYKWNLFPYSLVDKAKRWHSLASFEVQGNWNRLVKKFCEKIFPISRVQNVRKQVINFAQEEGIDQAWERFNGLIKQGPRLGFSGDVLLHTFLFFPNPQMHVVCSNVCRRKYHGENTHGGHPITTKIKRGGGHANRLGRTYFESH